MRKIFLNIIDYSIRKFSLFFFKEKLDFNNDCTERRHFMNSNVTETDTTTDFKDTTGMTQRMKFDLIILGFIVILASYLTYKNYVSITVDAKVDAGYSFFWIITVSMLLGRVNTFFKRREMLALYGTDDLR